MLNTPIATALLVMRHRRQVALRLHEIHRTAKVYGFDGPPKAISAALQQLQKRGAVRCTGRLWQFVGDETGYPGAQHVNKRAHPQSEQRLQRAVECLKAELDRQGCAYGGVDVDKLARALLVQGCSLTEQLAWLLRRNLEDGDSRMAIENCNALISVLETGEAPNDLPGARALHATIAARLLGEANEGPVGRRVVLEPKCTINDVLSGIRSTLRCIERDGGGK